MGRPPLPEDLLRVDFYGRLEPANSEWLDSQVEAGQAKDRTAALEDALFHIRRCPLELELPPRERGGKRNVHVLLDASNAAWIAEQVRSRRFDSDASAVDFAIVHRRLCKRKIPAPLAKKDA